MPSSPPYLPARDLKVERAIGRFIIAWGALEREIDRAIHDLLLTNLRTGAVVTANLAMRGKLDLAHALFEELRAGEKPIWRPISAEWESRFDDLVNMTAKVNADSRIPIVHSQPQVMHLDDGDRPFWVRMMARKGGLRGMGVSYSKAFLDKHTSAVIALAEEWAAARDHWEDAVHAMRSADADEWLSRGPDEPDHLTLQLRSIPDSPKPKPKQPRPKKPSRRAKREAREAQKV
jgi:hypothetical protein